MKLFNFYIRINIQISRNEPLITSSSDIKQVNYPSITFSAYAEDEINHAMQHRCFSTAKNYKTAVRTFRKYTKKKDIKLDEIDARLIGDFEKWLKQEGICLNTISCYMRSLRALYNKAVANKYVVQKSPFKNVFTGKSSTLKRAIPKDDIVKLRKLRFSHFSFMQLARDLFLFSFYACGMPFVDMAFLRKKQVSDGYMTYERHKTGQQVRIKIEPCLQEILNYYAQTPGEYVFPLLTATDKKEAYTQYHHKLCYYNKVLKVLAKAADIDSKLTSYVPRHSWASEAYAANARMSVISKALGHSTAQTTKIYIDDNDESELCAINSKLIKDLGKYVPLYKSYKLNELGDFYLQRCKGNYSA